MIKEKVKVHYKIEPNLAEKNRWGEMMIFTSAERHTLHSLSLLKERFSSSSSEAIKASWGFDFWLF